MELAKELAEHPLTLELKRRGITEQQLAQSSFLGKPFELGVFNCPANVPGKYLSWIGAFCTLRWLLQPPHSEHQPPHSEQVEKAWAIVRDALGELLVDEVEKSRARQKGSQKKATAATRKYSDSDRTRWKTAAASLSGSNTYKARIIAKHEKLPREAERTIRKELAEK